MLRSQIMNHRTDETGAVTVDWVVLTAAIVGLGLSVIGGVRNGTSSIAQQVDAELSGAPSRSVPPEDGTQPILTSGGGAAGSGGAGSGSDPSGALPGTTLPPASGGETATIGGGGSGAGSGGSSGAAAPGRNDSGTAGTGGGTGGNDPVPVGPAPGAGAGGASGGSPGTGGTTVATPAPTQVDFTFDVLNIGCWWSDRAVSNWTTFNFAQDTTFRMRGDGNPTAQNAQGQHTASGDVRWGTNIRVDIPPPGSSRTVFIEVGNQIGSFTINRAACT